MKRMKAKATAEFKELLRDSGDALESVAIPAHAEITKALELPLRKGVLSGDIVENIFEVIDLDKNATAEFPLDLLAPGTEGDYVAYTVPNQGRIPERHVEGDYVQVPIYDIANAIDWLLKYSRDARWDIVNRAMEVYRAGFVKKINDDGWHVLMAAAVDRNIIVYDADASAGQFTKRLVSLAKVVMRRNGGGNSTSLNRGKLTDLYISPEAVEDMRSWGVDQVDEVTRREIFVGEDGTLNRIFSVNIRDLDELGVGQEYELFFENDLGGAPVSTGTDVEVGFGLDLESSDSFIMPLREELQTSPDPVLHRSRRAGFYGWQSQGFAALDNRRIITVSL